MDRDTREQRRVQRGSRSLSGWLSNTEHADTPCRHRKTLHRVQTKSRTYDKHYVSLHVNTTWTCMHRERERQDGSSLSVPLSPPGALLLFIHLGPPWYFCIWLIWIHTCFQSLDFKMFLSSATRLPPEFFFMFQLLLIPPRLIDFRNKPFQSGCGSFTEIFITEKLEFELKIIILSAKSYCRR